MLEAPPDAAGAVPLDDREAIEGPHPLDRSAIVSWRMRSITSALCSAVARWRSHHREMLRAVAGS